MIRDGCCVHVAISSTRGLQSLPNSIGLTQTSNEGCGPDGFVPDETLAHMLQEEERRNAAQSGLIGAGGDVVSADPWAWPSNRANLDVCFILFLSVGINHLPSHLLHQIIFIIHWFSLYKNTFLRQPLVFSIFLVVIL